MPRLMRWVSLHSGVVLRNSLADLKNVIDWDRHTIKGTNMKLEKSYLRLTSVCPS